MVNKPISLIWAQISDKWIIKCIPNGERKTKYPMFRIYDRKWMIKEKRFRVSVVEQTPVGNDDDDQ